MPVFKFIMKMVDIKIYIDKYMIFVVSNESKIKILVIKVDDTGFAQNRKVSGITSIAYRDDEVLLENI